MDAAAYRAFTAELLRLAEADDRVTGLVAVGSMAEADYTPDEWSDHDFLLIAHDGRQEELRADPSWLPRADEIVLSFRETEHGLKVVYADGHMLEFAVFALAELELASIDRYRVLLDDGGIEERCRTVRDRAPGRRDDTYLFGMTVTAALVAAGRARRGETLSASFFVTSAVTHLARLLARTWTAENASLLDAFDPLRRFERVYPELGADLASLLRLPPEDGASALLAVLERELRPIRPELAWTAVDAIRARLS